MSVGRSRAVWLLGGLAIVLGGALGVAGLTGKAAPAANGAPPASWQSPGGTSTPSPPTASSGPSATASPTTPTRVTPHYVFPVVGNVSYAHTHHDYPATDIIAACGSTVRAATDGVVLEVNRVDRYDPRTNKGADRGGLFVSILGDDGVRYYGSHLRAVTAGIDAGVRVRAGQTVGQVGQTGDASVCHLHFGISPICGRTGDWWIRRGVLYPWPYLDSWRRGGSSSPVSSVQAWHAARGCPPVTAVPDA